MSEIIFDPHTFVPTEEERKKSEEMVARARAEELQVEDLRDVIRNGNSTAESRSRARAYRGNAMRSLNKCFRDYESFSLTEAAQRTGIKIERLESFLLKEAKLGGSQIVNLENGEFMIRNPFE